MGDVEGWKPLSHEIICECLSLIERTVAGSGYAFTKLNCSEKELTHLGNKVQAYTNLKYVTLSKNQITALDPVSKLPHVLHLAASENRITKEGIACMLEADLPWCQNLDLSINALSGVVPLSLLGRLRILDLQQNQITTLEGFDGHQNIEVLKLQQNQLESLAGLGNLPKLKKLLLNENKLTSLEGIDAECLEDLDASKNQLASLNFIEGAPNLLRVNVSENQLQGDDNIPEIKRLDTVLPSLEEITASSNPMYDTFPEARTEILLVLPRILKIDDTAVEDQERQDAEKLKKVRAQELAEVQKKSLADKIENLKAQLPEDVQAKLADVETQNAESILAEFPPPPEPSPDEEGAEDAEPKEVEKPDPMPKLMKEIALLEDLLKVAELEAEAAGIGKEEAEGGDE